MNSPALFHTSWLALAACALTAACSANSGPPGGSDQTGGASWGGSGGQLIGGGGTTGGGGLQSTGGLNIGNTPVGGGGNTGSGGSCSGVSQQAEKILGGKADIIWAIDSSGSMLEELAAVQNNMNLFSQFIIGTGIDVHVVAVAVAVGDLFGIPTPGLCIAPPLGSGANCLNAGDSRPPVYTHVPQVVDSHDAFHQLMNTYPQWQSAIRPDSTKTFVVVTDDEANNAPSVAEFRAFFDNAWQGSKWRFSGIYCRVGEEGSGNCENPGNRYDEVLNATGGIWADLGTPNPDWQAVFKQLGDAVVADAKPIDCEWKIPPAPMGQTFDKNKVNVDFTGSSGTTEGFVKVTDQTCPASGDGWFYDNDTAPTTIRVCPQTCTKIQADQNAKIDIALGCDTRRPIM